MTDLANARTQELRCKILSLLDAACPDPLPESLIFRGLQLYRPTLQDLQRELLYLSQRKLITLEPAGSAGSEGQQAALLALGVDLLEGNAQVPGVEVPAELLVGSHECARRQMIRWRMLVAVDSSRPIPLLASLAQRILQDALLPVSDRDLRRVANYLAEKGLLQIKTASRKDYSLELTADGVDVATYQAPCPAGVGRPTKYW